MDKIRIGIIGVGAVVECIYRHLYFHSDYSDLVSVEAICDVRDESLAWYAGKFGTPPGGSFTDHREMLAKVELDAVAVNTPDCLHHAPVINALDAGLDVLLAKPLADRVGDAHDMIEAIRKSGRFLGVDFHKRHDPRVREARKLIRSGTYGTVQHCVWYMMNKLLVSDPNHQPRFFASLDYAEKNSPMTFLGVHAVDTFMTISGLRPAEVRATGYKQKMRCLEPKPVEGWDMIDAEVRFDNGVLAHFITGWHLPDTMPAGAMQWARLICTDGLVDIKLDTTGYHEVNRGAVVERNPIFISEGVDGKMHGYGIESPGAILASILKDRNGALTPEEREELLSPSSLGFDTTLVCHGAHASLDAAAERPDNVFHGPAIDLAELIESEIGDEDAKKYV